MVESETLFMEYKTLGRSGLKVSRITCGTTAFDSVESAVSLISAARKCGVNSFDLAEMYGSPQGKSTAFFGEALRILQSREPQTYRRKDLVISTKIFKMHHGSEPLSADNGIGNSRKHISEALNEELSRCKLNYVDIVYSHRFDKLTPVREVVEAFSDAIRQGKAHYWGTSHWPPEKTIEAHWLAKCHNLIPPVVEQCKFNLLERKYLELYLRPVFEEPYSMGAAVWSVLRGGVLTGKHQKKIAEGTRYAGSGWVAPIYEGKSIDSFRQPTEKLIALAHSLAVTSTGLAIAFALKHPKVTTVLLGARNGEQFSDAVFKALRAMPKVDEKVMAQLNAISPKPELDGSIYGDYSRFPVTRVPIRALL